MIDPLMHQPALTGYINLSADAGWGYIQLLDHDASEDTSTLMHRCLDPGIQVEGVQDLSWMNPGSSTQIHPL